MKKMLCLAACAVMVMGVAANAEELTLSITSGGAATVTVSAGATVDFEITGVLEAGTEGLGLWAADLDASAEIAIDGGIIPEPTADPMVRFVKTAGLTNPAGYGGTFVDPTLMQIGGAQNTIGYSTSHPSYPNPDYPVGAVLLGVANTTETLAEGSITAPSVTGTYTMTISGGFANTIDLGEASAPYAVSAATIAYGNATLTVNVGGPPNLTNAYSRGYHEACGTWAGGDVEYNIGLADGLCEPRVQDNGSTQLDIRMVFDAAVTPGALVASITPNPGVTHAFAAGAGPNEAILSFASPVPKGRYDVLFTAGANGGFPICYIAGDVDCSCDTTALDMAVVQSGGNWLQDLNTANSRADVNRDGCVTALDMAVIQAGGNWLQPVPAETCTCTP
jgi:hypothetical protein